MFAGRYFPNTYFAPRYFPNLGAEAFNFTKICMHDERLWLPSITSGRIHLATVTAELVQLASISDESIPSC